MRVIQGANNVDAMLKMYGAVMRAPEVEIRGQKCRNLHNMAVILDARMCPITSFKARKLNLQYAKREWLWYLGADPKDDSIQEHASMWKKLQQPDGSFYSNYGQYMFGKDDEGHTQFSYVVKTLKADPNSRRATMMLLQREHLFEDNVDTVCTYAINFTIENGYLHMTVMMRSNDVIFGFTNDAFCFWQLYLFVYTVLAKTMPNLKPGEYTHFTNSMHVYDRHYAMIKQLVSETNYGYYKVDVPDVSAEEVLELLINRGKSGGGAYGEWLQTGA